MSDQAGLAGRSGAIETGTPNSTSPPGRRCAEEGCETVLSIYNEADTCSVHSGYYYTGAGKVR